MLCVSNCLWLSTWIAYRILRLICAKLCSSPSTLNPTWSLLSLCRAWIQEIPPQFTTQKPGTHPWHLYSETSLYQLKNICWVYLLNLKFVSYPCLLLQPYPFLEYSLLRDSSIRNFWWQIIENSLNKEELLLAYIIEKARLRVGFGQDLIENVISISPILVPFHFS